MPQGIGRRSVGVRPGIGRKPVASQYFKNIAGAAAQFTPGTYTYTIPASGTWTFVLWGAGGGGTSSNIQGGGSGAYLEVSKNLAAGQNVSLTVGDLVQFDSNGNSTVVTFPDGTSATAGGGFGGTNGGAGGTPSGTFDYSLSGSAGGGASQPGAAGQGTGGGTGGSVGSSLPGGAGAPGRLPFRGGAGGPGINGSSVARTPGGGGGCIAVNSGLVSASGAGLAIAFLARQ